MYYSKKILLAGASVLGVLAGSASAQDLIVDGSLCVGLDCAVGESFGFDTIRMKENNLRISAVDTSASASFPDGDWQLTFNETSNGGKNKFSVDDISNGRTPFTIEANAPSNSLYVEDGGKIGMGTASPVTTMHAVTGNTPTLRLEQDGSSGFTAQTFDIAANEANFFVRDTTNGSTLPFRIKPGAASDTLVLAANDSVGIGTQAPTSKLHVKSTVSESLKVTMEKNLGSFPGTWEFVIRNADGEFAINNPDSAGADFIFRKSTAAAPGLQLLGNVTASGTFISSGTTLNVPDYVFEADYDLMPLAQVQSFIDEHSHLPSVPSAADVKKGGLNLTDMQLTLLKKIEELTLYTLAQEEKIAQLEEKFATAD